MYKHFVKRILDIVFSFIGILLLGIPMLVIAIIIKIEDPGPAIFKQKRVGQSKKHFMLLKFRSMRMETPHDVPTHQLTNPEQYLLKFGSFMRKYSLDELPQLFNILKGEMSFVGPRPALWNQYDLIAERDKYDANDVKPGLTGWAQINGRDELEIPVKAQFDGEYICRQNIFFDFKCIVGTFFKVIAHEGVVEGGTGRTDEIYSETDKVSIIMPMYNTEKFVEESIHSVLNQTYTNWELLVVDDCSKDGSVEIVKKFCEQDERIILIQNEKNSGAALSRNTALMQATGKWIAFLDSDDLWECDKLKKQISFMRKNNYHFSYTNYTEIDDDGKSLGRRWTGPGKVTKFKMYLFNYMGCLTVMYDREYVGQVQVANLKKRNDYALWVKVVKKCPAFLLKEDLAVYRVRQSGSIMDRKKNPLSRLKYNYYLWRRGEEKSIITSCILTGINLVFGALKKVVFMKKIKE